MYLEFLKYIKKYNMIQKGEAVVIGLSGGTDSVCLFHLLNQLKKEMDITLYAVHINHGLRGESAKADEAFVRDLCEKTNIQLFVYREKVELLAKEWKLSTEEAGRNIRRTHFMDTARKVGATKIALAHHKNDDAETIIMNLCRGTGVKGMTGIAPVDGMWIRPLLTFERKEIEQYLKEHEISYCVDESNFEDGYTRNRIRNHVMPYLVREVNSKTVDHIQNFSKQLLEVEAYMEEQAKNYYLELKAQKGDREDGIHVNSLWLDSISHVLKAHLLKMVLCDVCGSKKDISFIHVDSLKQLFEKQVGKVIEFPYETVAEKTYEGVWIHKNAKETGEGVDDTTSASGEHPFYMRKFPLEEGVTFPESDYTKWFDYDIIQDALNIRHRQPGDFIVVDQEGSRKKLKDYFINEKVPQKLRDEIWLVAEGSEILWIAGYRQSKKYQITEKTKTVLEIVYQKE